MSDTLPDTWLVLIPVALTIAFILSRRKNWILENIRGPSPDSFMFGRTTDIHTIIVSDFLPGSLMQIHRQDQAGDFDFACIKEYGPTWRVQECFGVSSPRQLLF